MDPPHHRVSPSEGSVWVGNDNCSSVGRIGAYSQRPDVPILSWRYPTTFKTLLHAVLAEPRIVANSATKSSR